MDNLIEETRKLSNTLHVWEFGTILQLFTKYSQKDPIERRRLVLEEYFKTIASIDNDSLQKEVEIIKDIFPQFDRGYILKLLDIIGNEENRIRIVIKLLLRKTNKTHKRSNSENSSSESPIKKPKLNEVVTIDDAPVSNVCDWNQPSTSKIQNVYVLHDSNQPSTSKALSMPVLVETNQPCTSKAEELHLDTLPTTTDTDKVVGWLKIGEQSPAVESNRSTPQNSASEFHLHKHLHEMFSNVSQKYIKAICKKLNVNKHEQPPEKVMNVIISSLVHKSSSDKEKEESITQSPIRTVISNSGPFISIVNPSKVIVSTTVSENIPKVNEIPKIRLRRTSSGFIQNEEVNELNESMTDRHRQLENVLNQLHGRENEDSRDQSNEEEEEEAGVDEDNRLIYPLLEIFPQACPNFIRQLCKGKENVPGVLDDLISEILEMDYPKRIKRQSPQRHLNASEQLELMKSILVDADPDYLQMHCDRLADNPDKLKEFISAALETHNYPTLKEFLRKQQISAQQKQYTTEFSIEKFLDIIPNPFSYFNDATRKVNKLDHLSQHYALCYLRNRFSLISLRTIRECFIKNKENFLVTCNELESFPSNKKMKGKRAKALMPNCIQNIPLLQEIAFYDNQNDIELFLNQRKLEEEMERERAKVAGLLQTCSCCFDDEVMIKDVRSCESGCVFCKDCVRKGAEVAFGDGKLNFPCFGDCSSHFSLQVLQAVLTPKMFSVIALKKQVEEVKAAGIEDLETCPFCDFATIPARDDKLFRCLNPQCMKESCRMCKEPSHVPLRCDEVEKDADVKARTYVENKMTEALLRTCYKCGMKFIKAEGCNKMTCSCGALMCYVCGQPVKDYNHFNGPGGEKTNLCPLYSDTNQLHKEAILRGAEEAKNEIGINNSKKLKIDPTADIQQHYKPNKRVAVPPAPINPFLGLNHQEVLLQERALQMYNRLRHQNRHHQ
ncbi:hypothetical protein RI129_002794 [Pyrocoelia pectoralis]|uniref:RING-type domain-containing protein n=1 Tax=Pyrocoelia pectoralis TaxID=417401 RepID=A0AAN7ZMH4_9COLE